MTKLPADHPFIKHAANLRAMKKALTQVERAHKDAIRLGAEPQVAVLQQLHALTIGMLAEARLRALVWDPDGFNERERLLLLRLNQPNRWKQAVEYAFRRQYQVPFHLDLDSTSMDATKAQQYDDIIDLLEDQLLPVITARNKIAHGQWVWRLKQGTEQPTTAADPPMNFVMLRARSDLILAIGELCHVLVVSEPTFQRDYTKQWDKIDAAMTELPGSGYAAFVGAIRASKARATGARAAGSSPAPPKSGVRAFLLRLRPGSRPRQGATGHP
jgi:hypothetical protein